MKTGAERLIDLLRGKKSQPKPKAKKAPKKTSGWYA